MRIRMKVPWGQHPVGDVIDISYSIGANLCYAGVAEEAPNDIAVKSVDFPPVDKMVRKDLPKKKANEDQDESGLRSVEARRGVPGGRHDRWDADTDGPSREGPRSGRGQEAKKAEIASVVEEIDGQL